MTRLRPILAIACTVVALSPSACASSGGSGPPTSGPTGLTTTTTAHGTLSLRGSRLSGFGCPPPTASGLPVQASVTAVTEVLICPLEMPNPGGAAGRAVTLQPSDPAFHPLLVALSAPDEPREQGRACPLYADVLQPIVASTAALSMLVHIPVDGCGHYQGAARVAIAAARGG